MQAIDKISIVTIAVSDQEEALGWFTEILGFEKRADKQTEQVRWLTVVPPQQGEIEVLLADWYPDLVGRNPMWVIATRDCQNSFEELSAKGVEFTQKPTPRPYGIEAIFVDLYGNKYALLAPPAEIFTEEVEQAVVVLGAAAEPMTV